MAAEGTPRVNFELLDRFINKRVALVGQVGDIDNGKVKVKAADGGIVYVELKNNNAVFSTPYVEFLGTVTSPHSLREESRTDYGGTLDLQTYNELCKLSTSDYSEIFI